MAIKNKYKVPKKQWNKWSEAAQYVFNTLHDEMSSSQWKVTTLADPVSKDHWEVICWNASWIAADTVDEYEES